MQQFGTLAGIINIAGIGEQAPLLKMDPSKYDKVIQVDKYGVYFRNLLCRGGNGCKENGYTCKQTCD